MAHNDTKQRILEAAQELFATRGYRGTSLRAITKTAGANLAAVNYHFGSKEALIAALIEWRLGPVNQERRDRLEEVRTKARREGRRPRVEDVVRAFLEPPLTACAAVPGGTGIAALVGQSFSEPDRTVRDLFLRMVLPVGRLALDVLCEALPETSRELLSLRLIFAVGALRQGLLALDWPESVPAEVPLARDPGRLLEVLVPFVTAGVAAP